MFDPASALVMLEKGVPAFKVALQALMAEREKTAREVLKRRIRGGKPWLVAEDQMAGMLLSFLKAAEEGYARENLDLLAQVIARAEHEPTFAPVEFRRWQRVLSEMSRDEILVLGRYLAGVMSFEEGKRNSVEAAVAGQALAIDDLVGQGKPFRDQREIFACLSALQRTGLVMNNGGLDGGATIPNPGLFNLARLVDFEDALT